MNVSAAQRRFRDLVAKRIFQLGRHSVPLFYNNDRGAPEVCGTALLLDDGKSLCLVTAAHVMDPLKTGERIFFYPNSAQQIYLGGKIILSRRPSGLTRLGDRIDLAIWRIPRKFQSALTFHIPVPISRLQPDRHEHSLKTYGAVGYPSTVSKTDIRKKTVLTKSWGYYNSAFDSDDYAKFGVSPESHIVIKYDRKRVCGVDGAQQISADPRGLSGSPLWLFWDHEGDAPTLEPVVGIVVEHSALHKGIIATGIQCLFQLMRESDV